MYNFLKRIAFVAITALAVVSCQKEDLKEQAINAEAQRPELTGVFNITSATQLPEGTTLTARTAGTNVTAYDVQGTYKGLLYDVYMKDNKKNDVHQLPVHIYAQGRNYFRFEMPAFQVGKMPGRLSVDIDRLPLNPDGTFKVEEVLTDKVLLQIGRRLKFHYDVTFIGGSFTPVNGGHILKFTLKCDKSFWNFEIFRASVSYDSSK